MQLHWYIVFSLNFRPYRLKHVLYFIRNIRKVGAVAPSSRFLSRRMVLPLKERLADPNTPPLRILEAGPGTGAITRFITPLLRPQDSLDVVEMDRDLHTYVSENYSHPSARFHNMNLLDFDESEPFDFIFSGIPYEAIPGHVVQMLWEKKLALSKSGTILSYFKYINIVNFRSEYERNVVKEACDCISYEFRNLPPARVFRLKIGDVPNRINQ